MASCLEAWSPRLARPPPGTHTPILITMTIAGAKTTGEMKKQKPGPSALDTCSKAAQYLVEFRLQEGRGEPGFPPSLGTQPRPPGVAASCLAIGAFCMSPEDFLWREDIMQSGVYSEIIFESRNCFHVRQWCRKVLSRTSHSHPRSCTRRVDVSRRQHRC